MCYLSVFQKLVIVDSLAFGFFFSNFDCKWCILNQFKPSLRAEISQIFSYIFHSSPATYFILVGPIEKKRGGVRSQKRGGPDPMDPPWIRPLINESIPHHL